MMTPELEAAIKAGVADGSIFSDNHWDDHSPYTPDCALCKDDQHFGDVSPCACCGEFPATLDAPSPTTGFSDSHRPDPEQAMPPWPVEFWTLSAAMRETVKVMWRCSCGEMWSGTDIERDVHVHAAFEGGTHRVAGPIFRDDDTEADVRAAWAKDDTDA
jgi:hypothetical protein